MRITIIAALVALLAGCGTANLPTQNPAQNPAPKEQPQNKQANATGDVKDGDTRAGDIASADEQDTYNIDLGDATEFEDEGEVDVPGRVDVHTFDAAGVEIEDGKPCEDIQLGFSTEAEDEAKTYTPHYVCWNPEHEGESGKTQIIIWSESGKTGDYSFTVRER